MKLCIADPPYLGRAVRWYGKDGRGRGYGIGQADNHPEAYLWDDPKTHQKLVYDLECKYDAWVIAMNVDSLPLYLETICAQSEGIKICVWHKTDGVPSGSRIMNMWEPVLVKVPVGRRGRVRGFMVPDVISCAAPKGFIGAKPAKWTRWVLDLMGYQSELDTVDDLFPGSSAVAYEVAQGVLL